MSLKLTLSNNIFTHMLGRLTVSKLTSNLNTHLSGTLSAKSKVSQKGSSLVIAIFIIVVVSLLATALVKMLGSSGHTIAVQVIGTRAYAAAHTGAEYKLQQIFPLNSATANCEAVNNFSLNASGLPNCSFSASCDVFNVAGINYYTVKSTGSCDYANGEQTSRTIVVEARDL